MESWNILKLLNWITEYFTEKKIDAPRLSAEMILSHVLQIGRIDLYVNFEKPVSPEKLKELRALVKRASENEPVQYLIGKCEFYSIELNIDRNCLIPRPETEMLVERAVEFLRAADKPAKVLDLCTGSGCIAIAIAKNYPKAEIIASDISQQALNVAASNLEKHNLSEKIELLCGDLFEPVIPQLDTSAFDLIISNPPYVSDSEFQNLGSNVKDHEPTDALRAGPDGLDIYKRIAEKITDFLSPTGVLLLEIGYAQGPAVKELLENAGCFAQIKIEKDFNNNDRVVSAHSK